MLRSYQSQAGLGLLVWMGNSKLGFTAVHKVVVVHLLYFMLIYSVFFFFFNFINQVKSAFKSLILKYYKCLWYCSKHNIWNLSNLLLSRKTWEIVDKYYSDKFNFPSRALIVVQRCYVCKGWVTLKATVKAEYEATNNCLNSVHQQKVTACLHFRPACRTLWQYLREKQIVG